MSASELYAVALTLLGAWGIFATRASARIKKDWSQRRRLAVLVDALFVVSCLVCAAALWTGRFRAWMAASIGLSYLLMIPLPCYFERVNRARRLHALRDLLFAGVAFFLFAVAAGLIPLSVLGL